MILLCVSKGRAARFFADFACRCIYWTASQRKTLSIYDQLQLIDDVKVKKLKLAAAAKKYGIDYSTAAKILKKEDDLRSCMQMNRNTNRKRRRQSVHKDVYEALTQ